MTTFKEILVSEGLTQFLVNSGGELQFSHEPANWVGMVKDPITKTYYCVSNPDEVEEYIISTITTDYVRNGGKFTLTFQQSEWRNSKDLIELVSDLSTIPGITISVRIIEDIPDDKYLIRYKTKGLEDTLPSFQNETN